MRNDGRQPMEIRPVEIIPNYLEYAEGSILIKVGRTWVLCAASVEERVPPHVKGTGRGWVTAEYSLLPRSTHQRTVREVARGKLGGRTHEIQRLIGRSLRSVVDLAALGERTIWVDCDVIQADGGTRTASVTGGYLAMVLAMQRLKAQGLIANLPVQDYLGAISVGRVNGQSWLDLNYEEDSRAEVDMNVVMTGDGRFVEIQGTAEEIPFTYDELNQFLGLARSGIEQLVESEKKVFASLLGSAQPWR
ncbi:MAG: ribonuclease PH [Firmicutes bacterium]|nr:ribonuclease PH [Bacillota bacterium]